MTTLRLTKYHTSWCIHHFIACVILRLDKFSAAFSHTSHCQAVFGGLLIWLVAVWAFRWKRYNAIHWQFQAKFKDGLGVKKPRRSYRYGHCTTCLFWTMQLLLLFLRHMELSVSQIQLESWLAWLMSIFLLWPSISGLLAATKELSSQETVSKHYAVVVKFGKLWLSFTLKPLATQILIGKYALAFCNSLLICLFSYLFWMSGIWLPWSFICCKQQGTGCTTCQRSTSYDCTCKGWLAAFSI